MARVAAFSSAGRLRTVTSRQNSSIQEFRELIRKRKPPDSRILIDGMHLLVEARQAGILIERAAFTVDTLRNSEAAATAMELAGAGTDVLAVSGSVMEALSPVRTPTGVVAIGRCDSVPLDVPFRLPAPLVMMAIDVQDPGNLGAMVRAAEAAGASGLVACGASADPFGWKALRGSMGSAFRLPIARAPVADAVRGARGSGARVLAAIARGGQPLFAADLRGPTAFLVGGEGAGLPLDLLQEADGLISIPMRAPVESLNVSVAAALLLYEAARQRSKLDSSL